MKNIKKIKRMEIVHAARKYLGIPWEWGGRDRNVSLDCGGLLIVLVEDLGLQEVMKGYEIISSKDIIKVGKSNPKSLYTQLNIPLTEIKKESAKIGDVELYYLRNSDIPTHCAIISDKGLIHTHQGQGKVIESPRGVFWKKRVVAAFSFARLED